ncbi:MAG TPA: ATP-binding cassette domain-containing protein [Pseudonocardiaceae bacterium]|nr:ATP-binding cassette domain-containing protein [Pseudonocardiaceae bacterium]
MSPGLHAEVAVHYGGFDLDVSVQVAPGEVLAVLGRNGSGKSTLLAAIAGLLRPDAGRITLQARMLTDTAARVQVPPHRRRIGLLAQQPLLFPHLSVLDNVAFGPRAAGTGRRAARAVALRHLAEVDATQFASRRPGQLSGGQAQRIALARALAAGPDLLLLDEPLSAVDVELAPALRALLRTVLAERLTVLVTHQVLDALVLADRVLVLDEGRVVEQGPTLQVLTRPRSAFAARLAGLNLVPGTATVAGVRTADGVEIVGVGGGPAPGTPAVAVFSPSDVAVHPRPPHASPRNVLASTVAGLEPQGTVIRVWSEAGIAADITAAAVSDLALHPGAQVWLVVKATEVAVHALPDQARDPAPRRMRPAPDHLAEAAVEPNFRR